MKGKESYGVYTVNIEGQRKTSAEVEENCCSTISDGDKSKGFCVSFAADALHYFTVLVLGLVSWGLLWCIAGDDWLWDGPWFRLALVGAIAWGGGLILQAVTTLPPLLAALATGLTARYLGYLDMTNYMAFDEFLRKLYPVIILGKGSLAWNLDYMSSNWKQTAALGILPWASEMASITVCAVFLLEFPWSWGVAGRLRKETGDPRAGSFLAQRISIAIQRGNAVSVLGTLPWGPNFDPLLAVLFGSMFASVSCPVVMPSVQRISSTVNSRNWPQLICTSGGVDTALSVGVFGIMHTFMFCEAGDVYRYCKAGLTVLVGIAVGILSGLLAGKVPQARDPYCTELRILLVLVGGLFVNCFMSVMEWGGAGAIAVLCCNATAAHSWAKDGWKLTQNPAATAYRVMWSALEPILFAFSATFIVLDNSMLELLVLGLGIILCCLCVRLLVTFCVCWNMTVRERLFLCCVFTPKAIVQAVVGPLALHVAWQTHNVTDTTRAHTMLRLSALAALTTTPAGFLLTNYLGPKLLARHKETILINTSKNS